MIRLRAVHDLLLEEIADIPKSDLDSLTALGRARSRATLVALLDWLAILTLFAFRARGEPFLALEGEQGLFSLALLAIATHAGFRLGQRQKIDAVMRAWDDLPEAAAPEE